MDTGGYVVTKKESEIILNSLFKINSVIKKSVREFSKNNLPGMWKEYQEKIKSGVSETDAFYSVIKL